MADRDIKVKDIADDVGVRQQTVSQIIHGAKVSSRISRAIADAIGLPLEQVFPKYLDKEAA